MKRILFAFLCTLQVAGAATVEELVPRAYPDVAPVIYPLAARSLLAHLIKLQRELRADSDGERWWAV